MSEFFERNCQALAEEKANLLLLERVRQTAPATDIEVFETGDGSLGLVYEGIAIHSLNGAVQEAEQLIAEYCKPSDRGLHLLFGLGLGYPLAEMSAATKEFQNSVILVFEPSLPLLRLVLENVDIAKYCEGRHLIINDNATEFYKLVQEFYVWKKTELDVTVLPSLLQKPGDKEAAFSILKRIPELIESQQHALQVGLTLSEAWVTHFIKLLPYWPKTQHFELLDSIAPDKPAVVVSAGPSLDRVIGELKALQDHAIIISVGRAVRPLLNAGIKPDFIAFIDYEGQIAQLENLPHAIDDCHLLIGPYTEEAVLNVPHKSNLMVNLKKYPLVPWVNKLLGTEQVPVDVLGTVSYLGLQAAYTMGCNPIILVGQDLAFTAESQYAKGALNTNQRIEDGHMIVEESPSYAGSKLELIEVEGQNGEPLFSMHDYLQHRLSMQNFAEQSRRLYPERKLMNASTGGIQIDGFENVILGDALRQSGASLTREEKQALSDRLAPTFDAEELGGKYQKLADGVQTLIRDTEALQAALAKNLDMLEKGVSGTQAAWHQMIPKYDPVKKELQKLIMIDPLIGLVMGKPSYHLNESVNKNAASWDEQKENLNHTIQFLESCQAIFRGTFYQAMKATHQRLLEAKNNCSPVSSSNA